MIDYNTIEQKQEKNGQNLIFVLRDFLLELLFPKACLGCGQGNSYLCGDCLSLIPIATKPAPKIAGIYRLYCASDYQNFLVKRLIRLFKYPPFAKNLAPILARLILVHLRLLEKPPSFLRGVDDPRNRFFLVPVPLSVRRLKWRGFNQAQEVARQLSGSLNIPLLDQVLLKTKETLVQADLPEEKRTENVQGAFVCPCPKKVIGKKIILVDDVLTTGTTIKEAARVLKHAGAKEVWGLVVAKG